MCVSAAARPESVVEQFRTTVAPMAERYVRPTQSHAHVVVVGSAPIAEEVERVLEHVRQNTRPTRHAGYARPGSGFAVCAVPMRRAMYLRRAYFRLAAWPVVRNRAGAVCCTESAEGNRPADQQDIGGAGSRRTAAHQQPAGDRWRLVPTGNTWRCSTTASVRPSRAIASQSQCWTWQANQLRDFPDARLATNAQQTYFVGLAWSSDGNELYASMASLTDPEGKKPGNTGNGIAVYRFANGALTPDRFLKLPLVPLAKGRKNIYGAKYVPAGSYHSVSRGTGGGEAFRSATPCWWPRIWPTTRCCSIRAMARSCSASNSDAARSCPAPSPIR